jgi:hypothetical protein
VLGSRGVGVVESRPFDVDYEVSASRSVRRHFGTLLGVMRV